MDLSLTVALLCILFAKTVSAKSKVVVMCNHQMSRVYLIDSWVLNQLITRTKVEEPELNDLWLSLDSCTGQINTSLVSIEDGVLMKHEDTEEPEFSKLALLCNILGELEKIDCDSGVWESISSLPISSFDELVDSIHIISELKLNMHDCRLWLAVHTMLSQNKLELGNWAECFCGKNCNSEINPGTRNREDSLRAYSNVSFILSYFGLMLGKASKYKLQYTQEDEKNSSPKTQYKLLSDMSVYRIIISFCNEDIFSLIGRRDVPIEQFQEAIGKLLCNRGCDFFSMFNDREKHRISWIIRGKKRFDVTWFEKKGKNFDIIKTIKYGPV